MNKHAKQSPCGWHLATVGSCLLLALASGCVENVQEPDDRLQPFGSEVDRLHFQTWLEAEARATDPAVADLYYAYVNQDEQRPWFLSPMISAEVLRFYLRLGDVSRSKAIGDRLLAWQHDGSGSKGERLRGAFPSEIERGPSGYRARYLYDAGDSMTVMEALLDLYEATGEKRYLDAARATGTWLRDVMYHGEAVGVWLEAMGTPMKAVTLAGDFDNRMAVGRTMFWLPTLQRLARLTGDESFARAADSSYQFLSAGRLESGAYNDHYDPGYPAQPFELSRFRPYGVDGSVVADDSLRAALGAWMAGDTEAASRFADWIPEDNGRVPGYITLATGTPHFPPGNQPYADVISTALYRSLAVRLDQDTSEADEFLDRVQADNGGWAWGWNENTDGPINSDQSTLTGLWAYMDLCPRVAGSQF